MADGAAVDVIRTTRSGETPASAPTLTIWKRENSAMPSKIFSLAAIQGTSRDVTLDLDEALGLVRLDIEGATDPRVLATVLTISEASGTK